MMAVGQIVEGPAWTGEGIAESPGRYPLRVEGAVFRLVDQLLPGIITTTRQARMYALHALAWPEAHERGLDEEQAETFVRRCEVVLAAIHHLHRVHLADLSSAHGEGRIARFIGEQGLEVERAARPGGLSAAGFGDVYMAPVVKVGLLSPDRPPQAGSRSELSMLREGLEDIIPLADRDTIPVAELEAATHLCLCAGPRSKDGELLRRVLFETAEDDHSDDRCRQISCHMLLEAIGAEPAFDVDERFRRRWGFGAPLGDPESSEVAFVACGWRAAILRNYSVGAWRALWRWLAGQLIDRPMTVEELGDGLTEALGDLTVADLLGGLPPRIEGDVLLPAEVAIEAEEWTPLGALRLLALGAARLDDLNGATRRMYIGTDRHDLGPIWVTERIEEWSDGDIGGLAHELAQILVRRAKRVALGKMRLIDGQPWIPSRLRDRDGLLAVRGEEGSGDVSLRTRSLAEVLAGLGALRRDGNGAFALTAIGEELRERTA
jgi:hypothetical protein